jgi:PST family polysaccharide transporter
MNLLMFCQTLCTYFFIRILVLILNLGTYNGVMRHWFKNSDYSRLIKNTSALGLVQLSNTLLPLITLPFLARVLGSSNFGLVLMAQATMVYFSILTDYGFNLSATKHIARHQKNQAKVSAIFSDVLATKCALLLLGLFILAGMVHWVPLFNAHGTLFYASFLVVVGNTFLPTFLFLGLEKMSLIAGLNFVAKCGFTGLIFWLIHEPPDYVWVHALWGMSYILVDILAIGLIVWQLKITWSRPSLNGIFNHLSHSFEYFLSRLAIACYLYINVIVVGIVLSTETAGHYGGAEKLLFAITTFYTPLIEAIYPYISRTKNQRFAKKMVIITTAINTLGCLAAYALAPIVVPIIFGPGFMPAIHVFQCMLVVAVLHLPSSMIGYPVLGALGYEKTANRSVMLGAITHACLLGIFFNQLTAPIHFVWIMIASQGVIFSIRLVRLIQVGRNQNTISTTN